MDLQFYGGIVVLIWFSDLNWWGSGWLIKRHVLNHFTPVEVKKGCDEYYFIRILVDGHLYWWNTKFLKSSYDYIFVLRGPVLLSQIREKGYYRGQNISREHDLTVTLKKLYYLSQREELGARHKVCYCTEQRSVTTMKY